MAVTSGCGQRPGAQSSCPGTGGQLAPLRATRICRGLDARDYQPVHEGETEAGRRGPGRKGARPQGTAGSALSTSSSTPCPHLLSRPPRGLPPGVPPPPEARGRRRAAARTTASQLGPRRTPGPPPPRKPGDQPSAAGASEFPKLASLAHVTPCCPRQAPRTPQTCEPGAGACGLTQHGASGTLRGEHLSRRAAGRPGGSHEERAAAVPAP